MRFVKTTTWLAYEDEAVTSNPTKQAYDWSDQFSATVSDANDAGYTVNFGQTVPIFDTSVGSFSSANTAFSWTLVTYKPNTYRIAWTGGTPPAFRTDRNLTPNTESYTFTVNTNATLTITGPASSFTGVVYGDTVFIPGPITGDPTSPINVLNQGFWVVQDATSNTVTLSRPEGESFTGISEVVLCTSDTQIQAFSSGPVAVGQSLCFNLSTIGAIYRKFFDITAVTSTWVEVFSTETLPTSVTGIIPGTGPTTLIIAQGLRTQVRISCNGDLSVLVNGSTGDYFKIIPVNGSGEMVLTMPIVSLSLKNLSGSTLKARVFEVE